MRFSVAVAALSALVAPVFAQSQDHMVMVGQSGLSFTPSSINASAGDTVTFVFYPKNHTVTQSTFATPCTKMPNGIASGFQPVTSGAAQVPAMTITINDTTPLWFYCGQTSPVSHCGSGMVFAVNPTAAKSFEAFQTAANATLAASSNMTSTNTTGTSSASPTAASGTGGTPSTGSSGSTGTNSGSGTAGSGSTSSGAPSPSGSTTSTTNTNNSGAMGMSVRSAPLLAIFGIVAGLLL